jgi:hypothetical protein
MLSFLLRVLFAVCICLFTAFVSHAAQPMKALPADINKRGEPLCNRFNGVEFKDDQIFSRDRDVVADASALFTKALKKLGCTTYDGRGKRNGIITVGLSRKRVIRHGLFGPGPEEESDTFHVFLSWSKGIENAETLPLTFTIPVPESADSGNDALTTIALQSLRELHAAINAMQNRIRAKLSVR